GGPVRARLVHVHALCDQRFDRGDVTRLGGGDQRIIGCPLGLNDKQNRDERQKEEQPLEGTGGAHSWPTFSDSRATRATQTPSRARGEPYVAVCRQPHARPPVPRGRVATASHL